MPGRRRLRRAARLLLLLVALLLGYVALGGPLLAASARGTAWGVFTAKLLGFQGNGTAEAKALELIYTPCTPSSCNPKAGTETITLPPRPGAATPPTWGLLDTVYLKLSTGDEVPPTFMWAPRPGVLNTTWIYYPLIHGTALLEIKTESPRVLAKTCPHAALLEARPLPRGCLVEPRNPAPLLLDLSTTTVYGPGGGVEVEARASPLLRAAAAAAALAALYAALPRRRLRR